MHDRHLIDIAVAAKRWRSVQRQRLAAAREKRQASEVLQALPIIYTLLTPERRREDAAAKALSAAKRDERLALKALAKLCDQAMPVEDALTVDEVRALPRIETVEMG